MKRNSLVPFLLLLPFYAWCQLPDCKVSVYDSTFRGYYFLTMNENGDPNAILDNRGDVVYYRPTLGKIAYDFKLQPNGMMSFTDRRKYFLMDSTFNIVDSIECKNILSDFHELQILPNGHFLLLGFEQVHMPINKYYYTRIHASDTAKVLSGIIQELDEGHNIVFEWHAKDHYKFDDVDSTYALQSLDWPHFNSVTLSKDGNILVSSLHFDEITKINRTDGSIMWRLGGKRNQFKFENCPVPFYSQRNIREISNGHITLLDGGVSVMGTHGARALEFELDEKNKIAKLVWSYTIDSSNSSDHWGNVQRLDNGFTLVDGGLMSNADKNADLGYVVVNSLGKKVFQIKGISSFRVYQYASLPFKLNRPQISCFDSLGIHYLRTNEIYKSYYWNNSVTSRAIPISQPGTYFVFVPYGEEGFISSEKLVITDITQPCGALHKSSKKKTNTR